ncbi:MAG TPA: peptidylprolyl isomerase [Gemmatimonadales bacterium]|nr:peptidylprolyl isomerase [Gemmatimonadales bacterium]
MRPIGPIVTVLALAGCGVLRDAFSAHPQVAGTAAGETLSVQRLASVVGHAQRYPVNADVVNGVASIYLDYAVLAANLGRARDLHDSTLVVTAQWPLVAQLKWERYHDRLTATRSRLTQSQGDSAFTEGSVRLFQHILVRVPRSAVPMMEQQKREQAARLLGQAEAQHGANFARLAGRFSEDSGSRAQGGYLPVSSRGQFDATFDSAAWALPPGAMSGLVRTPFGFHIIRRPPLGEVRDSFRADLERARSGRLDSLYLDSLAKAWRLEVASGAPAMVRQAVPQIVSARQDERSLASYRGGAFRVKDLARWLLVIDPNVVRSIGTMTEAQLTQLVTLLAQRDLLLQEADLAGVGLTAEDWRQVRAEHDSMVARVEGLLGVNAEALKDSATTAAARAKLVMAHVDGYVDHSFTQGTVPFYPMPPFFAGALRQGEPWSLNEAGLARALEAAQAIRARDTTGRTQPPTGLKRAPGPPPVAPQ